VDEAELRCGIGGLRGEIVFEGFGGFGLFLRVETFGKTEERVRFGRLDFEGRAKFWFGVTGALEGQIDFSEAQECFNVMRVETRGAFKRLRGGREIAGSFKSNA
jgi:hypothetical protein